MNSQTRGAGLLAFLTSLLVAVFGPVAACPIPVYQYALEHWAADACEILVERREPLTADQRAALELLDRAARGEGTVANLRLQIRQAENENAPARLDARFPERLRIRRPFWSGELTLANSRALLSSPVRKQLGEALLRRTSAVWLLLESGDRQTDREVERRLRQQLDRLEKSIVIPATATWGGESVKIDSQVNFMILRVRRDDPAERLLVSMLLGSEADLASDFADQPMVFPVYGRGLLLHALVGRGINAWTIENAVKFLTGPCSCQIKAANPGTDLLLEVDWAGRVTPLTPAAVGDTTGVGGFLQRYDEAQTPPKSELLP